MFFVCGPTLIVPQNRFKNSRRDNGSRDNNSVPLQKHLTRELGYGRMNVVVCVSCETVQQTEVRTGRAVPDWNNGLD